MPAGCSVYDRPLTLQEAWDAAVGVCNISLETWADGENIAALPEPFLVEHDFVTAFESGWRLLDEDVSLRVCDRRIAILADVHHFDPEFARDRDRLRANAGASRERGRAVARAGALEAIAIRDTPTWAALCGLRSERPAQPEVLPAMLAGASAVSAMAFASFSTRAQIRVPRQFTARLPDLLLAGADRRPIV